jgi:MFS family permease
VLEVTEHLFSFPTDLVFGFISSGDGSIFGNGTASPGFDTTGGPSSHTIGGYTLAFAVAYLFAAHRLDRSDRRGIATAFTFAAVVTTVIGIALFSDDLEQVGTGLAYVVAGIGVAYLGALGGRRLTTIVGGILVFGGATAIVAEPFETVQSFAIAEMAAGAVVVAAAHLIATFWHEPAETDPVLSRFYSGGSVQPSGPPPPPAGSVLG